MGERKRPCANCPFGRTAEYQTGGMPGNMSAVLALQCADRVCDRPRRTFA
jgi:hypothetical protein